MANNQQNNLQFFNFFKSTEGATLIPFTKILFGPYVTSINYFREFFYIGGIYAFLISLIRLFSGQSVFCNFGYFDLTSICNYNIGVYIGSKVVILYLVSVFCVRYYQSVWQEKDISLSYLFRPQKTDLWSFLASICFLIINSLPALSWYILKERVPNPDWRIELTFFGFVSIGFVIPLICLRFYSLLADVWSGGKISSVYDIWKKSRGNNLRMIFSVSILLFVLSFSTSGMLRNLSYYAREASYGTVIIGDILYSSLLLLIIGFLVNNCGIQKKIFNKESLDGDQKQD